MKKIAVLFAVCFLAGSALAQVQFPYVGTSPHSKIMPTSPTGTLRWERHILFIDVLKAS
jgi:hypothetical protein